MNKFLIYAALTLTMTCLIVGSSLAQNTGTAAAGWVVFKNQCAGCHSNQVGVDQFGPSPAGVYGRMSGTAPLHCYSAAMKSAHIVWDAQSLNKFLENPRADIYGTTMPYRGLASATERANVIVYLKSISVHS